ncbi:MAG: Uma2 family endonuclease [Cyanobacteria bacterium RI_101]|nr:Uma2 family endonuclease [Cyanobacteria bacterium RI_101]
MVQSPVKSLSLREFLVLPETKPATEYLDGQLQQKPMPQGEHSTIQGELIMGINAVTKRAKIARAYPELRCTFGGSSIVPDVAVFRWENIPRNADGSVANAFNLAPDWVIEILSPDQSQTKVTANILRCLGHGCPLGWLIDPKDRSVLVFFGDRPPAIFSESSQEYLPVPDFAASFELSVQALFSWLWE